MCESIDKCGDCPLMDASTELCYLDKCPKEYNDSDFIQHEAAIMKWAAENPEVRYPTWWEWQRGHFHGIVDMILPCEFMSRADAHCSSYFGPYACSDCANQPIPADIAQKLGVKPIKVALPNGVAANRTETTTADRDDK